MQAVKQRVHTLLREQEVPENDLPDWGAFNLEIDNQPLQVENPVHSCAALALGKVFSWVDARFAVLSVADCPALVTALFGELFRLCCLDAAVPGNPMSPENRAFADRFSTVYLTRAIPVSLPPAAGADPQPARATPPPLAAERGTGSGGGP